MTDATPRDGRSLISAGEYGTLAAVVLGATIVGVGATETPIDVVIVGTGSLGYGFLVAKTVKEGLIS
jgi:hypothetical protein